MQTIYLDISNKGVIPCVQAKQSEVGRKFLAVITDNGVPYNIPDNSLLSVWYEGDTDAGNYSSIEEKSAFSIDGNKVTVELVAQMLLKPGNGDLCLSVTHGNGGETNTWNIPYEVEYKPGAGSSVPTEYYTALTEAGAYAAEQATIAKQYAYQAVSATENKLDLTGGTMTGAINMGGNKVTNLGYPSEPADSVNLKALHDICRPNGGNLTIAEDSAGAELDNVRQQGGWRLTHPLTICDMDVAHLYHFNGLVDGHHFCCMQIGCSYDSSPTFVIRWNWYGAWSPWRKI